MRLPAAWAISITIFTVGCAPAVAPHIGIERLESPSALLVHPKSSNWSSNLVVGKALALARQAAEKDTSFTRGLQAAMSNQSDASSLAYGASASTGSVSSAPTYFYGDGSAYWLTETGWVLKRSASGATSAFKIPGLDLFPNTALVISNDGKRLYAHSSTGNFYAINSSTGANVAGSPVALGGSSPTVGFGPPPFIDAGASLDSGFSETIYVVSNNGTLHRILGTREGGASGSINHVQSYALPLNNAAPFAEFVRSGPVVYKGRVVVSVWRKHNVSSTSDRGALVDYNTHSGYTTSPSVGSLVQRVELAEAAWAPPAVEYDWSQASIPPSLAFLPTGSSAAMVNMTNGDVTKSVPLVVDNTLPVSGNLNAYPYSGAGVTTVTVTPSANTSLSLYSNSALDTANIFGASKVGNGLFQPADNRSVYGLMRFPVTTATITVGGVLKSITNANLLLRVNAAPIIPLGGSIPTRVFRTFPTISSGALYHSGNLNFGNRPAFMGNAAQIDYAAGNWAANASWEGVPNTDNDFDINTDTVVSVKGLVGAPNLDYAFTELHADPQKTPLSAFFGGRTAPRFEAAGANPPRLVLTLSQSGFTNPTVANPLVVNAYNNTVLAVMCNSVFQLDYGGGVANPSFAQRSITFMDDARTQFSLTRLGRNTDGLGSSPRCTVLGNPRYVENTSSAMLEYGGNYLYVVDEHPNSQRVSVNRYTLGTATTAPTLDSSLLLSNASGAAQFPTNSMAYDLNSKRLFLATRNSTNTVGRVWTLNRF